MARHRFITHSRRQLAPELVMSADHAVCVPVTDVSCRCRWMRCVPGSILDPGARTLSPNTEHEASPGLWHESRIDSTTYPGSSPRVQCTTKLRDCRHETRQDRTLGCTYRVCGELAGHIERFTPLVTRLDRAKLDRRLQCCVRRSHVSCPGLWHGFERESDHRPGNQRTRGRRVSHNVHHRFQIDWLELCCASLHSEFLVACRLLLRG